VADVSVVIAEPFRLLGDRLDDLLLAVANVHAIETGEGVQAALAVAIDDVNPFAPLNDAVGRFFAGVGAKVSGRMEEMVPIPAVEAIILEHWLLPCEGQGRHLQVASRQRLISVKRSSSRLPGAMRARAASLDRQFVGFLDRFGDEIGAVT
jgi:hypothetical protein